MSLPFGYLPTMLLPALAGASACMTHHKSTGEGATWGACGAGRAHLITLWEKQKLLLAAAMTRRLEGGARLGALALSAQLTTLLRCWPPAGVTRCYILEEGKGGQRVVQTDGINIPGLWASQDLVECESMTTNNPRWVPKRVGFVGAVGARRYKCAA